MHLKRMLASVVAAVMSAVLLCPAAALAEPAYETSAFATQSKAATVASGGVFPISIIAPDYLKVSSLNVFKAQIRYDADVFEAPDVGDFACNLPWTDLRYNPKTRELVAVSREDVAPGSRVATLTLKVHEGVTADEAKVRLTAVEASGGEVDVTSEVPICYVAKVVKAEDAAAVGSLSPADPVSGGNTGSSWFYWANGAWRYGEESVDPLSFATSPQASSSAAPTTTTSANPSTSTVSASSVASDSSTLAKTGSRTNAPTLATLALLACAAAVISWLRAKRPETQHAGAASKPATSGRKSSAVARNAFVAFLAIAAMSIIGGFAAVGIAHADIDGARYDVNSDGKVDDTDVFRLAGMLIGLEKTDAACDLNGDDKVTVTDLSILAKYRFSIVEVPEDPGVSDSPEASDSPVDPGTPDSPDDSENPDSPENPGTSEDPEAPDEPDNPDSPEDPDTPDSPDNPDTPYAPAITVPDTTFQGYDFVQQTPQDLPVTYEEIQMRTDAMKERGIYGDHSQWPTGLEISDDGKLMLVGTDCAGLYRSLDGGSTWEQSNLGMNSRSTCAFAIDPNNSSHALTIGGARAGDGMTYGGVYETLDAAETWTQVNIFPIKGTRFDWDCFEFDPTTFDSALGITTDVYISAPYWRDVDIRADAGQRDTKSTHYIKEEEAGLYKSTDGGKTFALVNSDIRLSDGIVKFTQSGDLYIGNEYGLFHVDKDTCQILDIAFENADIDGFTTMKDWNGTDKQVLNFNMGVTGFDVVGDKLFVQTWDGIYTKSPADADFQMVEGDGTYSKLWPQFLAVSPADPDVMVMTARRRLTAYYDNYLYYSHDGGVHWEKSVHDSATMFSEPNAWNSIERMIAFDPFDASKVTVNGNGTITQSTDGGATFVQTNGISNLMSGGKINLNYYDPSVVTLGAQDFTGVISTNGGDTWRQLRASKDGDQTRSLYGCYSPDGQTIVAWGRNKYGLDFTLMTSQDAGSTWTDTGLTSDVDLSHSLNVMQSYNDPDVLLADEYRSTDRGLTWEKMDGCLCAYTINYTGAHEIYGGNAQGQPVVSYDEGATWQVLYEGKLTSHWALVEGTERIDDLAYDHVNNILYIFDRFSTQYSPTGAVNAGACRVVKLPLDDTSAKRDLDITYYAGYKGIRSIAIDPNCTSVLYVAGSGDSVCNPTALYRSIDGGETFTNLTASIFTVPSGTDAGKAITNMATNQGGYEANQVRVDPLTGRVIIGTNCYGFETANPPYDSSLLDHTAPSAHVVKYVVDGEVMAEGSVMNGHMLDVPSGHDWFTDSECTTPYDARSLVTNSMVLYAKS